MADFHDIASQSEKCGKHRYSINLIIGFNEAIKDSGLTYLGIWGHQYTWERGRGTANFVEEWLT